MNSRSLRLYSVPPFCQSSTVNEPTLIVIDAFASSENYFLEDRWNLHQIHLAHCDKGEGDCIERVFFGFQHIFKPLITLLVCRTKNIYM